MVPTLLTLTLGLAPVQEAPPAGDLAAAHAVIQVSREFGVETMTQLVQSASFTASIQPRLLPGTQDLWDAMGSAEAVQDALAAYGMAPVGEHVSYAIARPVSPTLAALTVVAAGPREAESAMRGILDAFTSMRSDQGRAMAETLAYKEAQLVELRADLAELLSQRADHRARCQGVNPAAWQKVLQDRLLNLRSSQFDVATEIAVGKAMRDHLVKQLDGMPDTVARPGDSQPNPAYAHLLAQMNRARKEYDLLQKQINQGVLVGGDRVDKLLGQIESLETMMGATPPEVRGEDQQVPNPERRVPEAQLLEQERNLARNSVELATMRDGIATLTSEVLQYQLLVDQEQELEQRLSQLRSQTMNLSAVVENLREEVTRYHRSPVVVVTGPGLSELH